VRSSSCGILHNVVTTSEATTGATGSEIMRTCHSDKSATGGAVVEYGEIWSKKPQNAEFSNYTLYR
jgi:hypothetical protein